MLGSLGFPEILFILLLALLVFGPKRLPEVGRKVGRALGEFRRATGDLKRSIDREMTMADMGTSEPPAATHSRSAESKKADEEDEEEDPDEEPENPYGSGADGG
jgi:sec-independent protein translocase protein TatA